jgi:hypothetical protein
MTAVREHELDIGALHVKGAQQSPQVCGQQRDPEKSMTCHPTGRGGSALYRQCPFTVGLD